MNLCHHNADSYTLTQPHGIHVHYPVTISNCLIGTGHALSGGGRHMSRMRGFYTMGVKSTVCGGWQGKRMEKVSVPLLSRNPNESEPSEVCTKRERSCASGFGRGVYFSTLRMVTIAATGRGNYFDRMYISPPAAARKEILPWPIELPHPLPQPLLPNNSDLHRPAEQERLVVVGEDTPLRSRAKTSPALLFGRFRGKVTQPVCG